MVGPAYIPAGSEGSNYYYAFSLLEYEDIPIVFVAVNDSDRIFLCDCVETRQLQRWIIAETDYSILSGIVEGKISVFDALTCKGKVTIAEYSYTTDRFLQRINVECSTLPDGFLPDRYAKLFNMPEEVKEKVRTICFSLGNRHNAKQQSGALEYSTTTESNSKIPYKGSKADKWDSEWFIGAA